MDLIFATANKGKLREASQILGPEYNLISSAQAGILEDIQETGSTLQENSLIKARYIWNRTHRNCFADDTGLEVEALGGAPGVHSARYATDGHDFQANIKKLLSELDKIPGASRRARFRSVVTLILDGREYVFQGEMPGTIASAPMGDKGFGYDPVFIADKAPQGTMAQLGEEVKNALSHRGQSLRAMAAMLKNLE